MDGRPIKPWFVSCFNPRVNVVYFNHDLLS